MSTDTSFATRAQEENWLPVLELAIEEVFEIMLGCRVKPTQSENKPHVEFTAMVGLAGALCGILTVSCDKNTAAQLAHTMLGAAAESDAQVSDALGEICNMVAGNFESGAAQMRSASEAAFDRIANLLRRRDYRLRIEGHTDSAPIHTVQFPSNWELSTARATEIVRLLIVREGFSPDRLSAAGYAAYHPVASNLTAAGRGMNRRVDIIILGPALPETSAASASGPAPAAGLPAAVPPVPSAVPAKDSPEPPLARPTPSPSTAPQSTSAPPSQH